MSVHHSILWIHTLVERSNVTEKHPFPTNCLLIMSGIIFQQPKSHPQQNKPRNSRVWNLNISGRYHDLNPAHLCHWKHRNCGVTRWFNSWPFHPLATLVGGHSTIWKGSVNPSQNSHKELTGMHSFLREITQTWPIHLHDSDIPLPHMCRLKPSIFNCKVTVTFQNVLPTLQTNRTWTWIVGIPVSFWKGLFQI